MMSLILSSTIGKTLIAIVTGIVAVLAAYFHGKSQVATQQQAKNDVANANAATEEEKKVADIQVTTIKAASDAKAETASMDDSALRERMRDEYTEK